MKPLKTVLLTILIASAMIVATNCSSVKTSRQTAAEPSRPLARPTPQQAAWQDMEIGAMICIGLETWQDKESDDEPSMENVKLFNPSNVDADQWVEAAESMGAKYIVFVAKHVGGFCLWQTESTEYSIKNSPYKNGQGDILAELAESCRKRDMKLGVYIYPGSLYHGAAVSAGGKTADPAKQKEYNRIYRQQLTEVLSRYGDMFEVWFDGSVTIPVKDILDKYAPNAMVFQGPQATIRWVGNEQGYAPYPAWNAVNSDDPVVKAGQSTAQHSDPNGDKWLPNEVDTTIRDHFWFWSSHNQKDLKSLDKLMDIYYNSVGHGAVLLLNVNPDRSGLVPEADFRRYQEFGAEIKRRFGNSLAETQGSGKVIELTFDKPVTIDHIITMEDITKGERVREYVIEGLIDGNWRQIAEGTAIGHKKIDRFEAIKVSKIRLRITKAAATPLIRKLAVYNTAATPVVEAPKKQPAGYKTAWTWSPDSVTNQWTTVDIDLSPYIPEPRQYELVFNNTEGEIEIESVVLVLESIEIPGFAELLDKPNTYNLNITATPSMKKDSIILRAKIRSKSGSDSYGQVLIKPNR